jgi:hypothetical protein
MPLASSKRQLKCAACDRTIERRSRQQIFCSARCRNRGFREKTPAEGLGSGSVTNPHKLSNENNILQWPKSGSSLSSNGPINLLGGGSRKWPQAGRLDSKTLSKIRWCEVGGEIIEPPIEP